MVLPTQACDAGCVNGVPMGRKLIQVKEITLGKFCQLKYYKLLENHEQFANIEDFK